ADSQGPIRAKRVRRELLFSKTPHTGVRIGRRIGRGIARLRSPHRRNNLCIVKVRQVFARDGGRYFASDVTERKRTSQRANHQHGPRIRSFRRVQLQAVWFQFRSHSLPGIDCPCWAAGHFTAAFEIDAGTRGAYHFANNTYRSRWGAPRARTHRAARAGPARIPYFLVLATGYRRRVQWCRPGDCGDAAAQPGHSVWRSALAVGELSAGNPPAKVGAAVWRGWDLSARTKLPGARNAECRAARRATIKGNGVGGRGLLNPYESRFFGQQRFA